MRAKLANWVRRRVEVCTPKSFKSLLRNQNTTWQFELVLSYRYLGHLATYTSEHIVWALGSDGNKERLFPRYLATF